MKKTNKLEGSCCTELTAPHRSDPSPKGGREGKFNNHLNGQSHELSTCDISVETRKVQAEFFKFEFDKFKMASTGGARRVK